MVESFERLLFVPILFFIKLFFIKVFTIFIFCYYFMKLIISSVLLHKISTFI